MERAEDGKDGIGSGISHQLFLIQFLDNLQGLIRADFKQSGTFILEFCKIISFVNQRT